MSDVMPLTDEELERMYAVFCECRPLDLDRDSHSHDCDFPDLLRAITEIRSLRSRLERAESELALQVDATAIAIERAEKLEAELTDAAQEVALRREQRTELRLREAAVKDRESELAQRGRGPDEAWVGKWASRALAFVGQIEQENPGRYGERAEATAFIHRLLADLTPPAAPAPLTVLDGLRKSAESRGALLVQWMNGRGEIMQAIARGPDLVPQWRWIYVNGTPLAWQSGFMSIEDIDRPAMLIPAEVSP